MNVVTLIGNLATEVELREVGPDKKVASFVLAVDRASREGGADFVRVSAWDRQAELCAEYLGKGRRIAVDGRLKSRSWEDEGKRRSALEVVARRVEFLGGGPRSEEDDGGEGVPVEAAAGVWSIEATNSRIAARQTSGLSPIRRCPQPAIVRSGAPRRRAYSIPSSTRTQLSLAPQRQRQGHVTRSSSVRGSEASSALPAWRVSV